MAKKTAKLAGWVFVIIGVLGFFGNPLVGSTGSALFWSDTSGNIIYLVTGVILLWSGYKSARLSRSTTTILGIVYVFLAILGFWTGGSSLLGIMSINSADNWLHLVLGAYMLRGSTRNDSMA